MPSAQAAGSTSDAGGPLTRCTLLLNRGGTIDKHCMAVLYSTSTVLVDVDVHVGDHVSLLGRTPARTHNNSTYNSDLNPDRLACYYDALLERLPTAIVLFEIAFGCGPR